MLGLAVVLGTLGVAGSAFATGSSEPTDRGSRTPTVHMTFSAPHTLRFVGPDRVQAGDDLRIVNNSKSRQVGPHTFSLVTRGLLPKTRPARRNCFAPNHICRDIAAWHGTNGNAPVTKNPAKAGQAGWDTMGNLTRKGDSWFTGVRPGTSITQQVSADVSGGPQRLFFMCAVHPHMQGSIKVVP